MMSVSSDVFADATLLEGSWSLRRTIHDIQNSSTTLVVGQATFERHGDGILAWGEQGTLYLPGNDVHVTASRSIIREQDGMWSVRFADGRFFHPWHERESFAHHCEPDEYTGSLQHLSEDPDQTWMMRWAARGPSKHYLIESVYRRES